MNTGKIVQVIGPVVDVQFAENAIPPIYQALTVDFTAAGVKQTLTLEIQQHLGGGVARAIAMSSSEGLVRGMPVVDTGSPNRSAAAIVVAATSSADAPCA